MVNFVVGFITGWIVTLFAAGLTHNSYQDGQIDCINGKIRYELVKQKDNTTEWIWIKQPN